VCAATAGDDSNNNNNDDRYQYIGVNAIGMLKDMNWDDDIVEDDDVCESIAVALHDIDEFIRYYPNGRAVITAATRLQRTNYYYSTNDNILGYTKDLIMKCMDFPREDVQEQALSCASKLLVVNWKALGPAATYS
jgi:hypothetical protein